METSENPFIHSLLKRKKGGGGGGGFEFEKRER